MSRRKEFIIVAPKMAGYEDWHLKVSALIERKHPNTEDSVTLTYLVSVGQPLHGIRAEGVYLHPDISDSPPPTIYTAAWFAQELACRLGPDAKTQFLAIADQVDIKSDIDEWCVFLKDASEFMAEQSEDKERVG